MYSFQIELFIQLTTICFYNLNNFYKIKRSLYEIILNQTEKYYAKEFDIQNPTNDPIPINFVNKPATLLG